jgi:Domain of unknown function (DUF4440)
MSDDMQDADRALVAALTKGDGTAAAALLDDDFNWVDANGRVLTKPQLAQTTPPLDDEAGLTLATSSPYRSAATSYSCCALG